MTLYLDSSVLLAILMDEPTADVVQAALAADSHWVTGRHTSVEVRRTIAGSLPSERVDSARSAFAEYWERTTVAELDEVLCGLAADLADQTRLRTLDALHLAAARRGGGTEIVMLTLDRRLWQAARSIGMATKDVVGFETQDVGGASS